MLVSSLFHCTTTTIAILFHTNYEIMARLSTIVFAGLRNGWEVESLERYAKVCGRVQRERLRWR